MMMNKKRSSKLELSKYAFLLPVMLLAGASFTVSQAESKIENVVDLTKETPVLTMTIAKPTERIDTTVNQTQEYPLLAPDFDKELVAKMSNYYEIDGKLVSLDEFLAFPRTEISGVDIYKDKDEIYKKIGKLNADALFVMTSKRGANFTVKSNLKSENSRLNFSSNDSTKNPLKLSGKVITFKGDFSIDGMQPLFIVDNKEMENGFEMKWLNPNDIESITVLKDESAEAVYGDKGKSGVILVQTKSTKAKDEKVVVVTGKRMESSQPKEASVVSYKGKGETMAIQSKPVAKGTGEVFVSSQKPTSGIMRIEATPGGEKVVRIGPKKSYSEMSVDERPLVVIDNVVQGSDFDFKTLNPDDIESISILKDRSAEAVYGDKGKNGVILLQTKSIKEKDLTTTVQESKNK